jgi:hypothetical protein
LAAFWMSTARSCGASLHSESTSRLSRSQIAWRATYAWSSRLLFPPVTAVAVELLPAPPALQDTPDPDAIILVADTDKLMAMCSCAASSDNPY